MKSNGESGAPPIVPAEGSPASPAPVASEPFLRWGCALLMLGGLGLLPVSRAIGFRDNPGAFLPLGRRLYAGGLATLALALLLVVIAAVPLRRGERWAFWAYAGVAAVLGLPMIILGTLYVPLAGLFGTLLPQFLEIALVCAGLALCAQPLYGSK